MNKTYCPFLESKGIKVECKFGLTAKKLLENPDLVKLICATCIKKDYSHAKLMNAIKLVKTYSTVSTL